MRRPISLALFLSALVGACATGDPVKPKSNSEWIMLSTYPGPQCTRCDSTIVIIHFDGEVFVERRHGGADFRFSQTTRQKVTIEDRATSQLIVELEKLRPRGTVDLSDTETCGQHMVDAYAHRDNDAAYSFHRPGIVLRWRDDAGEDKLNAYFGCLGSESVVLKDTIKSALNSAGIDWLAPTGWE